MLRSSLAARLASVAVLVLVTTALAVPALAARSHAAAGTLVTVTATEFHFKLVPASAPHGLITFKLVNKGKLKHDFKIVVSKTVAKKTSLVSAGGSTRLTVRLPKGTYRYLCTVAGHAAAGMKGTFVVR